MRFNWIRNCRVSVSVCQTAGNLQDECRALIGLTTVGYYRRELADIELYGKAAMALAEVALPAVNTGLGTSAGGERRPWLSGAVRRCEG